MNIKRSFPRMGGPWIVGGLLAASLGLAGCAPKTSVSTTANVPAHYSHVFVTVQEVWFNTSATATPDDTTGWVKFPLTTPVTIDLAASMSGQLASITTGLSLAIATYSQVRLFPVDPSTTLTSSASALGALYNMEVDYTDSANNPQQVPLELLNPDKGIGIQTSIHVTGSGASVLSSSSSSSTTNCSTTTGSTTNTSTTGSTSCTKIFTIALNVDGSTDLVPFTYATTNGTIVNGIRSGGTGGVDAVFLSPHLTAYDSSLVGAIQGTLSLGNLTDITTASTTAVDNIQVTAESLSTDGTRHVVVNSTPVKSDGTFTLYPLSSSSSSQTSYDLVIHGPTIATIVVKAVPVAVGDPTTTTAVNIGTITPRAATGAPFTITLNTTTPLPAGALVGFYQTLPGSTEVPYVIEQKTIDPFTRTFQVDSTGSSAGSSVSASPDLDTGTYSSGSVSVSTVTPQEGAGVYRLAASAPLFADGPVTSTTGSTTLNGSVIGAATVPTVSSATNVAVAVPTLVAASGITNNGTVVNVSQTNSYDRGDLILSHDGAIVATAVLDTALSQGGTRAVAIPNLPAGGSTIFSSSTSTTPTDSALYYVSVRVWKSSDPAGTVKREIYPSPLDLRSSTTLTSTAYSLTID